MRPPLRIKARLSPAVKSSRGCKLRPPVRRRQDGYQRSQTEKKQDVTVVTQVLQANAGSRGRKREHSGAGGVLFERTRSTKAEHIENVSEFTEPATERRRSADDETTCERACPALQAVTNGLSRGCARRHAQSKIVSGGRKRRKRRMRPPPRIKARLLPAVKSSRGCKLRPPVRRRQEGYRRSQTA